MFWAVLTVVGVAVMCPGVAEGAQGTVGEQLRLLLREETILRENLGDRIQSLRAEASSIGDTIVPCSCNQTGTRPVRIPQVSYTGTLPSAMTSLTTSTSFNFTDDLTNIGQPFNITSGHFVVPVSGIYGFSLTMYMDAVNYWTVLELVKNDQPFMYVRTGHYTSKMVNMATNFGLVNATVGDEVWVKFVTSSGTRVYADGVSTFTGVLLFQL